MTSPTALTATIAATTSATFGLAGTLIDAVPMPPFMAPPPPILPTVAPAPAPTLPSATIPVRRIGGRAIPAVGRRPDVGPVANAEIENNRARDDRHFCNSRLETDLPFVKVLAHAGRDIEPERAAA